MNRQTSILVAAVAMFAIVSVQSAAPSAAESNAAIQGVWRTVQVVVAGGAGGTFKPEATLAIFHGRHYSRVEVHAEQPRPILDNPASASAVELRAVWGPFFAEAGTFEISGDRITMHSTIAKNPAAMRPGASSVYTYRREGDTLTLTQLSTPAGPAAAPVTATLARVEE